MHDDERGPPGGRLLQGCFLPEGTGEEWTGREVVLVGRFASMPRAEVRAWLAGRGATWTRLPREGTDRVIVGQGGPPLGRDGRPARALRLALELQERGRGPRILSEQEWLADHVDPDGPGPGLERLYTTGQLARVLGVPAPRLRAWVRQGLLRPARRVARLEYFDFREVASARALEQLTRAGVRPAELRRGLEALARWLPTAELSLAQLERIERGPVTVRLEDGRLAEPSGQLRLGFEEAPEGAVPVDPSAAGEGPALRDGEAWFERGLEAEEDGDLDAAARAYEEALRLDGLDPAICFNLGNVLYSSGRAAEAAHRYLQAAETDPEYVEAWNNLGNVLAELGQAENAVRAYRCALEVSPTYPDAHYNLAEALAGLGRLEEAREHWRAYLAQDPFSRWARRVRERLARLDEPSP